MNRSASRLNDGKTRNYRMNAPQCWIHYLSDPWPESEADANRRLGRKGESLRRMVRAGFDVPAGFVITTDACRQYFELDGSLPPALWPQVVKAVERLERETGCDLGDCSRPLLLAVRSGAPESMPGVLDTVLNCGLTDRLAMSPGRQRDYVRFIEAFAASDGQACLAEKPEAALQHSPSAMCERRLAQYEQRTGEPFPQEAWEQLRRCIGAVMQSWQRSRAVQYRQALGLPQDSGTAVIVQAMVPCEVSGVLFTQDPRDSAEKDSADSRMVVETVAGLGEELVAGRVTPQRFYLARDGASPAAIADDADEGSRPDPLLTSVQLSMLRELGLRLEREFSAPLDVEWGWAENQFAILQTRPIQHAPQPSELGSNRNGHAAGAETATRNLGLCADTTQAQSAASDPQRQPNGTDFVSGAARAARCEPTDSLEIPGGSRRSATNMSLSRAKVSAIRR